ncbi:MAG: hypothetical protein PGN23_15415 [Sphingomonas adhaesiva]|uniref:hypothetical protein n=1 Tax=Sphingomonas adhaesiva TaxID=28212 RepID=UPI002FF5AF66
MMGMGKKAVLGTALAASVLATAAPAEAQRYWRRDRGGDAAAGAIIGGVIGLGLGAAIASSNRDRFYDRGYYDDRYYAPPPRVVYRERYYAPPPPVVYRDYYRDPYRGYYGQPRGYYGYGW